MVMSLSPTEECMIRCYRKVYKFANDAWFWLWTTALIYTNKLREMIYGTTSATLSPITIMSSDSDIIYIVGDFAKEHVIASTIILSDGSEVDFDESHIQEYNDVPVTAGQILSMNDIKHSPDIRLSVIMSDGKTCIYSWDEPLVLRNVSE